MAQQSLTIKSYPALLSQLKKVFIEGMQRIEEEKVRTYWRTGELISNSILKNKDRADYASKLFDRLSEDLNIHKLTLQRAVKFYRTFPIASAQTQLTWMHFRQLISIEDKSKRELFAERSIKKGWGYRELEEAIRLDRIKFEGPQQKPKSPSVKLSVNRAQLFTYRIIEPPYIKSTNEEKIVDLGFNTNVQAKIFGVTNLKNGEIIETKKTANAYTFRRSNAGPKDLFTFVALVERVVDADTHWLNVDCGFKTWSRQEVRLRGIDCPELSTKEGQEAKKFVEARLKEVDFIVIKTYKDDKYGRILADIFYPPIELWQAGLKEDLDAHRVLEQGVFLNQELLDKGLARMW